MDATLSWWSLLAKKLEIEEGSPIRDSSTRSTTTRYEVEGLCDTENHDDENLEILDKEIDFYKLDPLRGALAACERD